MSTPNLPAFRHLVSFASFAFVTLNLLLCLPLLLLAAAARALLPFVSVQQRAQALVEAVYRVAVRIDAWWFAEVLGMEFALEDVDGALAQLAPADSPVIVCNHQSWFDIFLLQTLVSSRGPILQFVIKEELVWVPVLGWICLALNFPRLSRKVDPQSRQQDRSRVHSASLTISQEPGGLLIFPEGTRSNSEKRRRADSPYTHLLRPKAGGLSVICAAMSPETKIVDLGIAYDPGDADCWRCMSGVVKRISVKADRFQLRDIKSAADWLNTRWRAKDVWMER